MVELVSVISARSGLNAFNTANARVTASTPSLPIHHLSSVRQN